MNIFRKGRVVYTPDPQFTCVITLRLKSPGATRFPSVTQFVRIKCKCLHTSGSFTWASASHAIFVTTDGGQLTNGKKHMTSHHQNLPEDKYYVAPSAAPTDIQVKTEVT